MTRRNWQTARAKVDREGECRLCSSHYDLQAAHVVPRSIGGEQLEESTVPLCAECHRKFDAHELDLLPALTYAEQAEAVRLIGISRAYRRLAPSSNPLSEAA